MARHEVIERELIWHERAAERRYWLDKMLYDPPAFDAIVDASVSFLQSRPGEKVLDLGCGEGKESMALACRKLVVIAVDLSHRQLARARKWVRAQDATLPVFFVQANAEELPFSAGTFRIIYGKAILHHLDVELAADEVYRLLPDKGRATFAEPLAHHPLFWLARRLTPRLRTRDEHPLATRELEPFGRSFSTYQIETAFLLSPFVYPFRLLPGGEAFFRRLHRWLQGIDGWLLSHVRFLRRFAWYGTVNVTKDAGQEGRLL